MESWIREITGAREVEALDSLESLWGGYGEIVRARLRGADVASVIVKRVQPEQPGSSSRGRRGRRRRGAGDDLSHRRKLRSYDVERAFYLDYAERCGDGCRVARCHAAEQRGGGWRFLLEDLDASGFDGRRGPLSDAEALACLGWLARFHATFLGVAPDGLWKQGTYWHLATRPDELAAIADAGLRAAAARLDEQLRGASHRTLVHGDAKPANFCFARDGRVAAVDFQYVGGGCGMSDVAYLLFGRRGWGGGDAGAEPLLDAYFAELRDALAPGTDADALEDEWRRLYPVARADFHRFLAGWSPGAGSVRGYRDALAALG